MTSRLNEYDLRDALPADMQAACENCVLVCSEAVRPRIQIVAPPVYGLRKDLLVEVLEPEFVGRLRLQIGPCSGHLRILSRGYLTLELRLWREVSLSIGAGATMNNVVMVLDQSDVTVGEDNLWSDEILVQAADQHGIIDIEAMELINNHRRHVHIGDHVWIGRRALVMPDVRIGEGSFLGAGSVLTSDVPPRSAYAGVPARLVRSNVTWSRSRRGLTEAERRRLSLPPGPDGATRR